MSLEMDKEYLNDLPLWADDEAYLVLERVCKEMDVPIEVITDLVVLQRERQHQERAAGIYPRFEEILGIID
jgi:hypothetical protein